MLFAIQTYTAKNYQDPDQPFYSGNYAVNSPKPVEALTIVSYNIWFGLDTDQALLELKEINSQKELDIVLLQEIKVLSWKKPGSWRKQGPATTCPFGSP